MEDVLIIDKTAQIKSALALKTLSTVAFADEEGGKEPTIYITSSKCYGSEGSLLHEVIVRVEYG